MQMQPEEALAAMMPGTPLMQSRLSQAPPTPMQPPTPMMPHLQPHTPLGMIPDDTGRLSMPPPPIPSMGYPGTPIAPPGYPPTPAPPTPLQHMEEMPHLPPDQVNKRNEFTITKIQRICF